MLAAGEGGGGCRIVASMYSWGGVRQKFRNDENNSEYFMAYEATKVFAIRKMKTQFSNKNTHIYAQTYYRSMLYEPLFDWRLRTRAKGPRKFLNLESQKCHFLNFGQVLTEF